MGELDDLLDRIDRAQGIGEMDDGDDSSARRQQLVKFVHKQLAAVVEGDDFEFRAGLLGQELPGDDVGMMLHARDDDFIAGFDVGAAEG